MNDKSRRESGRGAGSITHDTRSGRWRLRMRIDDKDRSLYFDSREEARLARRAHAESLNTSVGITLRISPDVDGHTAGMRTGAKHPERSDVKRLVVV